MKKLLLLFLILGIGLNSNAQDKPSIHLSVDVLGGGGILGTQENRWDIRQTFNSYSYYETEYLTSNSFLSYISLKPEFRFSKKLSFYTGLRYTDMTNSFSNMNSRSGFFYVRFAQYSSDETHFYRVKSIEESAGYLSIPLEVKYSPIHWRGFSLYGRLGTDFGLLIYSKRSAELFQPEMQQHEADVLNVVPFIPNNFLSTAYAGIGLGYEFKNRVSVNADLPIIKGILTKNHSSIFQASSLSGVQVSLSIPLSKNDNQ